MARPAHPNRRQDILEAARHAFVARGFAGARMEDIAKEAGISKAAVYLQFESKEAMFRALVSELIASTIPRLTPPELGEMPAEAMLRAFIEVGFQTMTGPELAFLPQLILGEGQMFPELARFYHDEAVVRMMGIVEGIIVHGIQRGEFACEEPAHACRSIAGGIVLTTLWRIVFEPIGAAQIDLAIAPRAHADTVINGLLMRKTG